MKKKIILAVLLSFLLGIAVFSENSTNPIVQKFLEPFNVTIATFTNDYSAFVGLYSANSDVKGDASIGSFPSFRVGSSVGTIFLTNPLRFLKTINIGGMNYEKVKKLDALNSMKESITFFDENFLPIPITTHSFEIGLPKGFSVGSNFHIVPIGDFIKAVSPETQNYISSVMFWGIGVSFNYTVMKEYKWFPSISVGSAFNYSSANFDIKIPFDSLKIDSSNDLKAQLNFYTKSDISTFSFDFTVSKTFLFFEPFVNFKFTQSVYHNITKIGLNLDMTSATSTAKSNYGDGKIGVSNIVSKDNFGNDIGLVIPITDFILSTGFEFIIKIYRLGFSASYALVSQKGMLNVSMRFQVEKTDILKKKDSNRN